MYDIIELSSKSMEELHRIANTLDIKKVESYAKNELIYQILDVQAESGATSTASSATASNPSKRLMLPEAIRFFCSSDMSANVTMAMAAPGSESGKLVPKTNRSGPHFAEITLNPWLS